MNRDFSVAEMFQRAAGRWPELPFWLDRPLDLRPTAGTDLTLGQVNDVLERAVSAFEQAGVRAGDRVAIVKQPNLDVCLLTCAAARIGAVPAPISPVLEDWKMGPLFERLRRPHLVTDGVTLEPGIRPDGLEDRVGTIFQVTPDGLRVERPGECDREGPEMPEDTALVIHTSGTTGIPKLIAYRAAGFGTHSEFQARIAGLVRWQETGAVLLSPAHGRVYSSLAIGLHRALPAVFLTDPAPGTVHSMFRRCRPGSIDTYPNVYVHWEDLAREESDTFSTVRFFQNTFDAAHPRTIRTLLRASRRRLPIWFQAYGSTETGPLTVKLYTKWTLPRSDARCVGHPMPGYSRIRVRPASRGLRHGPIEASVRAVTGPYIAEPDRVSPASAPDWWGTLDVGFRSRWGCVHLLDRAIDVSDGIVSNLAVEDAILARAGELTEVVLLAGLEDRPVPVVCVKDDRPLDLDLWRRVTAGLPPLAEPVQYRWEDLPRTTTWKVRRVELRRELAERRGAAPVTEASPR